MTYKTLLIEEALTEHDKGCCTMNNPCMWREGLSIVHGSQQLRPTLVAVENPSVRTRGTRLGSGSRADAVVAPTPAQAKLWDSLLTQMNEFDERDGTDCAGAINEEWKENKDFKRYSQMIGDMISSLQSRRSDNGSVKTAAPRGEKMTPGMYQVGAEVFKVQPSKSGHLYALALTANGFEYARGAMSRIRPEHRMSKEDAQAYGRQTGQCCCCGRALTNPDSIAAGIGPVCAGKF